MNHPRSRDPIVATDQAVRKKVGRHEHRGRALGLGHPPEHDLRHVMDAILHVDRIDIPCRYLPHDFPPWPTVYGYFAHWLKDASSSSSPACCGARGARKAKRQIPAPACRAPRQSRLPRRAPGRPRHRRGQAHHRPQTDIGCDTLGLLLTVWVTTASLSDNTAGLQLLSCIATTLPR